MQDKTDKTDSVGFYLKRSITEKCIFEIRSLSIKTDMRSKRDIIDFVIDIQDFCLMCDVWKIFAINEALKIFEIMCVEYGNEKIIDRIALAIQTFCGQLLDEYVPQDEFNQMFIETSGLICSIGFCLLKRHERFGLQSAKIFALAIKFIGINKPLITDKTEKICKEECDGLSMGLLTHSNKKVRSYASILFRLINLANGSEDRPGLEDQIISEFGPEYLV